MHVQGLGKTVQALAIAACYPEDWPLLVVCPSSMRLGEGPLRLRSCVRVRCMHAHPSKRSGGGVELQMCPDFSM